MARIVKTNRQTPRTITLELTEGEADYVLGASGRTGGHPARSMRKYADRIGAKLEKALGYGHSETDFEKFAAGRVFMREYNPSPEDAARDESALDVMGIDSRDNNTLARDILRDIPADTLYTRTQFDNEEDGQVTTWRALSRFLRR